jgi:hypothetical protein
VIDCSIACLWLIFEFCSLRSSAALQNESKVKRLLRLAK